MNKNRLFLLLILSNFFGCKTDFDVVKEANPTPVIYCILNQDSTVQYLRLSRTYITRNGTQPIGESDSVMFARATKVAIEEVENGTVVNRAFFTPYTMAKDSGFFPNQEHWVYRANFTVKPETDYRMIVYIDDYNEIVYASCYTVGNFQILNPLYPEVRSIHMLPDHNLSFFWTKSNHAAIYQLGFIMHYLESGESGIKEKQLLIPLNTAFYLDNADKYFTYAVNSTQFYNYIAEHLTVDSSVLRQFISLDALIISGGEEIGYYINMQQTDQIFSLADYTNIQNGIGVLSSKIIRKIGGFSLTEQSIDSLAYSKTTNDLNFVDRTGTRDGR